MARVEIRAEREGAQGATFTLTIQGATLPHRMSVATLRELALQARWALEAHEHARARGDRP